MKSVGWLKKLTSLKSMVFVAISLLVGVIFGIIFMRHSKPADVPLIAVPQTAFDPSIYHQPGSNDEAAIKDGEWLLILRIKGKTRTFPTLGKVIIEGEKQIYEDKDCVFASAWQTTVDERSGDWYKKELEIWNKWGVDDDYELLNYVRIYNGKRRVFKSCSQKERVILTMPEDISKEINMWNLMANQPTPMPTFIPMPTIVFK